jgi:hypothetical protein
MLLLSCRLPFTMATLDRNRSFLPQISFKPAVPSRAFSCGGAASSVGLGEEGSTAHDEARAERGSVGERLKRKGVGQRGGRTFIDVESGGWPVQAPYRYRGSLGSCY